MPNDLGQPLKGKVRNNCRLEHDIHRTTPRVEALRLTKAVKLIELTLSYDKSELRAGEVMDKRLLTATPKGKERSIFADK